MKGIGHSPTSILQRKNGGCIDKSPACRNNASFQSAYETICAAILYALYESSYAETEKTAELMDNVSKLYEELISFSDLYDSASFEAKKMIVNQLIRRVDVYRGYQLNITFNFDLTPYIEGDDAAAC